MKKMILKYWKRLNTKTQEEILWDEYCINKNTIETLKVENRKLNYDVKDLDRKNWALEKFIFDNKNFKGIRYNKIFTDQSLSYTDYEYNIEIIN
jgi:hypothetical protein